MRAVRTHSRISTTAFVCPMHHTRAVFSGTCPPMCRRQIPRSSLSKSPRFAAACRSSLRSTTHSNCAHQREHQFRVDVIRGVSAFVRVSSCTVAHYIVQLIVHVCERMRPPATVHLVTEARANAMPARLNALHGSGQFSSHKQGFMLYRCEPVWATVHPRHTHPPCTHMYTPLRSLLRLLPPPCR